MKSLFSGRSLMVAISLALSFNAGNLFATEVALVGGSATSAGAGYVNGNTYTQVYFSTPSGMAMDDDGNLWVADRNNNAIRVISNPSESQSGASETLTFAAYTTNLIVKPISVAFDSFGDLYILDYGNGKNGNVVEYDTEYGVIIATNAINLTNAAGMTLDNSDNIYVTVNSNQILEVTALGVTTNITTITNAGTSLQGLVMKNVGTTAGFLAVCDSGRNGIYLVNPTTGVWSTNAGFHGAGDFPTGTDVAAPQNAQFNQPMDVAETGDGSLIVSDYGNNRVKVVKSSDGGVTNLYGVATSDWVGPYPGFSSTLNPTHGAPETVVVPDAVGGVAAREPNGIVFSSSGTIYVTEEYYDLIRIVTGSGLPLPAPGVPLPPTGLLATPGYGQVVLTWTASSGATSYDVERSTTNGGPYALVGTSGGSPYTDTGVVDGTTYYYVISAINASGGSPLSSQASASALYSPAPTITGVVTNYGSVTLTWGPSVGATSYNVFRSPSLPFTSQAFTNVTTTTFTDTNVTAGDTYYYAIQTINSGGTNPTNSPTVVATLPLPPVPDPQIGWITYPLNNGQDAYLSVFNPGSEAGNTFHNDVDIVIVDPSDTEIFFNTANTTVVTNVPNPTSTSSSANSGYTDGLTQSKVEETYAINSIIQPAPNLMVKAIGEEVGGYPNSDIVSALFQFVVGNPEVIGTNAAQFVLTNITVGANMYYTTDGSFPSATNPAAVGPITNGEILSLGFPVGTTNLAFESVGYKANYTPSPVITNNFAASNYVANTISFGFASGQASSKFIASPGQTFYAPVTLTLLSGTLMNQLQFSLTVTNAGPNPGPPITPGSFDFQSMLMQPIPGEPNTYEQIPTYMFINTNSTIITNTVYYNGSTNFVNLTFTNIAENLLGVGWEERQGMTNLYPTTSQDLIQYSIAHDTLYLASAGQVIAGGYSFQVPVTATSGQTYQIQINAPSATTDGIGDPGSAVFIQAPQTGSLTNGTINAIKDVTMGQLRYVVGDVYPFAWFNAGDFGETNLIAPDVAQVFQSAIYNLNYPPYDPTSGNGSGGFTNVSDFYDAMDSCGATYVDLGHGYLEKNSTITSQGAINALFSGNDQTINQIGFGDGILDVCDVYVTYRRSLDPSLVWFQRFWTNGVRVAVIVSNTIDNVSSGVQTSGSGKVVSAVSGSTTPISITNMPTANFTTPDYLATAGQTLSIPINVNVFGQYPLRVAMINVSIDPLDGSPPLTTPVSFINGSAMGSPYITTNNVNSYAAAWLDSTISGISTSGTIGTLVVTIPTNATSMSSYAIHFDHASGSPNGIASFTKHTLTGLITLSSRTTSSYNDGIPDSWRLRYFGTIYNYLSVSNADADGTGMENWQKYQAGLNPTDPTSVLNVGTDQVMAQSPQDSVIAWPTISGETYVIQRSANLFPPNWIPVSTNIGNGTYMEIHDSPTNWYKFYRVQAQ